MTHESSVPKTQVWLTPPWILESLGEFDLDPCASVAQPWQTAHVQYTIEDDGLSLPWFGRVWLNPPYARWEIGKWMDRMTQVRCGLALLFARTDTEVFQDLIFPVAESILFVRKRIKFCLPTGEVVKDNSGAPSVLISYSEEDAEVLEASDIEGYHQLVNPIYALRAVGRIPQTWRELVDLALRHLGGEADVAHVFDKVQRLHPEKVRANKHSREKVRQILQYHFHRVAPATYKA